MRRDMQKKLSLLIIMLMFAFNLSGVVTAVDPNETSTDNKTNTSPNITSSDANGSGEENMNNLITSAKDENNDLNNQRSIQDPNTIRENDECREHSDLEIPRADSVNQNSPNSLNPAVVNPNERTAVNNHTPYTHSNYSTSPFAVRQGSWDIVGLDANNVSRGPNQFYIQLRVTNNGNTLINNVTGTLEWLNSNPYIQLAAGESIIKAIGSLAPGETKDLFYLVEVVRNTAAFGTERDYRITVSGNNVSNRTFTDELEVRGLISNITQQIISITASNLTPNIGDLFNVTVVSRIDPRYVNTVSIPIINYDPTKIQPVSVTNFYDSVRTNNLRIDCPNEAYITSIWTFRAVGSGNNTLVPFIYDKVNPYFYNADFGQDFIRIIVGAVADIAVTKTPNILTPNYLTYVLWTITATNNGPSNATGVQITDTLPAGLLFINATTSAGTSFNAATGIWNIGNLTNGTTATLQVLTQVLGHNTTLTDVVNVTAQDQYDPNTTNNRANSTIYVPAAADIGVTKTVNNTNPAVNDTISFIISVINNGPDNATGVRISDILNARLQFLNATASPGTSFNATTGVWNIGNLGNGAFATLTIVAKVLNSGTILNTATKSASDQYDQYPLNDTASVIINATESAAGGGNGNNTTNGTNGTNGTQGDNITPGINETPQAAGGDIETPLAAGGNLETILAAGGEEITELVEIPLAAAGGEETPLVHAAEQFAAAGEPVVQAAAGENGVSMQNTGLPIGLLILALLMTLGGLFRFRR
ncbi:MAG: DUF11 domain-containing protein [Methanobacterium sp.]